MANIKTIAQSIADNVGKPFDEMFLERLKYEILSKRATVVRNDFTRNRTVDGSLVQDVSCLEMDSVSPSECCDTDIDCKVTRTTQKVPKTINLKENSSPFLYVGGIDKTTPYTWTQAEKMPYILSSRKFTKRHPYYTYLNGYIYVFNSENERLNVRGIFEDPTELYFLKNCDGQPCGETDEIPLPKHLEKQVKDLIYDELGVMQRSEEPEIPIDTDGQTRA